MPASIKHLTDKKLNLTSLLALWKDGLYYTAAIVKCDKANKKCLVCFEDGSEIWVRNRDVHIQLSLDQLNEDEDIVCCICDDGSSEPPNEIILCDVCQQGYHQKCHCPPVDSSKIDESEDTDDHKDWFCATCSYILDQSNRANSSATEQQPQVSPKDKQPGPQLSQSKQTPPPTPPQPHVQPATKSTQQPTPQQSELKPQSKPRSSESPKPVSQAPVQQQTGVAIQKQPAKVKQTPTSPQQQQQQQKSTIGPIKPTVSNVNKPAPYYPLSNQARAVATSSTAALASMTASSALVVGSSAGRSKQDLVNQSQIRGSARQQRATGTNVEVISPPVKHAVRKSSVNFVMPVRQSALPTATRSVLPANNLTTTTTPSTTNKTPIITTSSNKVTSTTSPPPQSTTTTTSTSSYIAATTSHSSHPVIVTSSSVAKSYSNINNKSTETKDNRTQQILPVTTVNDGLKVAHSPVIVSTIGSVGITTINKNNSGDSSPKSSSNSIGNSQANNSNKKTIMIVENTTNNSKLSSQPLSGPQNTVVTPNQPTVIVSAGSKSVGPSNSSS